MRKIILSRYRAQRSRCVFPVLYTPLTCLADYSYPNKSLFHILEHPDCIAAAGKASQSERKQPTRHVALPPSSILKSSILDPTTNRVRSLVSIRILRRDEIHVYFRIFRKFKGLKENK